MTVLAIGAVVLGLVMAPTTTDLTVSNGAGQTLLASQVNALYTRSGTPAVVKVEYVAPDFGRQTIVAGVPGHHSLTVHGAKAKALLAPVSDVLNISGFTKTGTHSGTVYVGSESASKLVPPSEAALVSGTLQAKVTVLNGYVTNVVETLNVHTPGGSNTQGIRYRITEVDGWKVTAA